MNTEWTTWKAGDTLASAGTKVVVAERGGRFVRLRYPAYGNEIINDWYPADVMAGCGWRKVKTEERQ